MTPTTLASFPEELLERILALCLAPPFFPIPRSHSHLFASNSRSSARIPTARIRIVLLLVSKRWLRIATPLVYNTLRIRSPPHATLVSRTFAVNPALGSHVRRLVLSGVWPEVAPVVRACTLLETLDITLDASWIPDSGAFSETKAFNDSLIGLDVRHLVVRKANVYLSQPKPRHVIAGLARAIPHWKHLATAHIDFRLSDDATGTGALLTQSLSRAPSLHTLFTQLPAVWNPSLLHISSNSCLERIVLNSPSYCDNVTATNAHGDAIVGTGLFLMEARKWPRLSELIRAGTNIIRTRAHTMGTVSASSAGSLLASLSMDDKRGKDQGDNLGGDINFKRRWEL